MRKRSTVLLALLLVGVFVMGCATFKSNTYKTLYSTGTIYDVAMKSAADLKAQGKITDAQVAEVMKIANAYYVAYQASVDAFETYIRTDSAADKDKLAVALADVAGKLSKIIDYVNRLRSANGLKPIGGGS
jgi:regulator of RNase E activity RraB